MSASPLVLTTATAREMRAVLHGAGADAIEPPEQSEWSEADLCDTPCLLLVTGVGPVNAGFALGRLLGAVQAMGQGVRGVCNLGVAGAFDLDVAPLGAAVYVDKEIYPEYGLRKGATVNVHGLRLPQVEAASGHAGPGHDAVYDTISIPSWPDLDPVRWQGDLSVARGTGLTVAGVTADPDDAARLRQAYAPVVESMEGFALALGCLRADVPFAQIRTISNPVGSRTGWDLDGALDALGRVAGLVVGCL